MSRRRRDVFKVEHQEPIVVHQETDADARREALLRWPKDKPLPTHYIKQVQPCRKCKRLRLDNMMQAVVRTTGNAEYVWFRCRGCQHRWQMPVSHLLSGKWMQIADDIPL